VTASNKVLIFEAEKRIGRGQKLRVEDHLDAIVAAVEELKIILNIKLKSRL
jgi:hypothetical protein